MLSFENDYSEGAHEKILERLIETNREQLPGYGSDHYCCSAKEKIRKACGAPQADIYFLTGGTQTNQTVISSMLRSWEGVIAADTGHISTHEAGAVEYTGHKVITIQNKEGKVEADALMQYLETFYSDENHSHMVYPGMVYISHPTEYGTLYTRDELVCLAEICRKYRIPLYMDGARLGYALTSDNTDVTLEDIADLCDVFYIGGTKAGALCGEAVVFPKNNAPYNFITMIKQRGALLAKGRLTGIQFDILFTDELYLKICRNAIERADEMKRIFRKYGCAFYIDSPTNQVFLILENNQIEKLKERVVFSFWEKYDMEHTIVRFASSWATKKEDVAMLSKIFSDVYKI